MMLVDGGIGDLDHAAQGAADVEAAGYDGAWTAETSHDPFLPLVVAAGATERLQLGTGIAVAFARNPMTLAQTGSDLQAWSKGRFLLGLGSQIKPHITRRFSMPWGQPAARMRELILAMHAIWDCWNDDVPLSFQGDFYTHTLMTPFFDPGPNPFGKPKVLLAAVGEKMTEVAGEVADGLLVHPFTTESYLREVTIPALERGMARSGRSRADLEISLPVFVGLADTDEEAAAAAEGLRGQIAFYGSTPNYAPVLEHHGWGEAHTELNRLSKAGGWKEMGAVIDDEVLSTFAVLGPGDDVGDGILRRFDGLVDRVSFYAPYALDPSRWAPVIERLHA